ncbi:TPA: GNAT family N-acetyltransferase [Candidatus Dependentiae bacterium]|nr:MAG: GNAT family acetyltransferase [candidate division TM6 bacterium GW2011_GWE2_31_21]KKP52948.1 MAG: GNAT family acetyltransferase [candidate division TM6 bacterium GW2011_GWF2_33_332]HBS47813.1 GNAT family N-acetyltransferase [Candidatus Dependentiae bacterium]HBZ73211.1 GNAT family N-acetyltransferase [Candidatus Dependentiae bacterium]
MNNPLQISRIRNTSKFSIVDFNRLLDEGKVWDSEQGKRFIGSDDNALFIAFWEGKAAGFLTAHRLQRFDKRKAEVLLYEVGVHQNYRRRGIGKALIEEVKKWATEVGADKVWVLTEKGNEAAMAMYRSAGGIEEAPGTIMWVYKLNPKTD